MKHLLHVVLLVALLAVPVGSYAGQDLLEQATNDIAARITAELPDDAQLRLLAIAEIKGDSGALHRSLTEAIKDTTDFILIERKELETLLTEQGLQVSDLIDRETRIKPGSIQGVEGILFGRVVEQKSGFMSVLLTVYVQLNNVETGEIVFARDFSASSVSPLRGFIIVALCCVVLLLLLWSALARQRERAVRSRISTARDKREDVAQSINRAVRCVAEAQDMLTRSEDSVRAGLIKDLSQSLQHLKQKIEFAAGGDPERNSKKQLKLMLKFDDAFAGVIAGLNAQARKISETVSSAKLDALEVQVRDLNTAIQNALNQFEARPVR